jgi:hypothetical protein
MKYEVDLAAWEAGEVPGDVVKVLLFVYEWRSAHRAGPEWSRIVEHMGWSTPRSQWLRKFKRMKLWGLVWTPNKLGSTRITKSVLPYLDKIHAEACVPAA